MTWKLPRCQWPWVSVGVLALAVTAGAQTATNHMFSPAKEIYETGKQYLQQSVQTADVGPAMELLQKAIQNFQAALEVDKNYCPADHGWALALVAFANRTTDRDQFLKAIEEARTRFAYAADCPDAAPQVFDDWGSLLLARVNAIAQSPAARYSILTEARQALMKGLKRARNEDELARFEGLVGQCLVQLVLYSPDPDERRALFEEANTRFESATQRKTSAQSAGLYATWGLALLKLGQHNSDTNLLWQGVQRMQVGLKKVPNDKNLAALVLHYNLACTYAALGEFSNAMRQLRACIENDPSGGYAKMARTDSDLEALSHTQEFQAFMNSYGAKPTGATSAKLDTPENRARALFFDGNELANKAAAAEDDATRARDLDQAIAKYRAVTEVLPDFTPAHTLWANCLAQSETLATNRADRLARIQRTRDQFAAAAKCPHPDAKVFETWGNYLASRADTLAAASAGRIDVLKEAQGIYEKGLQAARFTGETAELQLQLGACLISMAGYETDRDKRPAEYEQATHYLEQAAKVAAYTKSQRLNGLWGVALARLGQLTHDRLKLREATQRIQVALDAEPDNPELNYNVACAYALLRDPVEAIRHLRLCFEKDPKGTYYKSVESDPDFSPIRATDEYKTIFHPSVPFDSLTRPKLSD